MKIEQQEHAQVKPYMQAIIWGIFSIGAYVLVFTHQKAVLDITTKGHWYAVVPIVTVFLFTFIHTPFCGHLLSLMGIEAAKKKH